MMDTFCTETFLKPKKVERMVACICRLAVRIKLSNSSVYWETHIPPIYILSWKYVGNVDALSLQLGTFSDCYILLLFSSREAFCCRLVFWHRIIRQKMQFALMRYTHLQQCEFSHHISCVYVIHSQFPSSATVFNCVYYSRDFVAQLNIVINQHSQCFQRL